jgi:hypothetical protein
MTILTKRLLDKPEEIKPAEVSGCVSKQRGLLPSVSTYAGNDSLHNTQN